MQFDPLVAAAAAAGGFLAANLAAHHPDSVRAVVLLNAAPFTSPYIPGRDLLLWRLLAAAADDSLPAPREVSQCIASRKCQRADLDGTHVKASCGSDYKVCSACGIDYTVCIECLQTMLLKIRYQRLGR
jgi:pimeloyl-ACP methyl ester carboxylesterase